VGLLFADGGGLREPSGELQSAAVGRRRTARLSQYIYNIHSGRSLRGARVWAFANNSGPPRGEGCGPHGSPNRKYFKTYLRRGANE